MGSGYSRVSVLRGGLGAWTAAGHALETLGGADRVEAIRWREVRLDDLLRTPEAGSLQPEPSFLPQIAGQAFLEGQELPLKREMVVLFVDMVGSTRLVFEKSAEAVLEIMQAFMEIVIDIGAYHCGDVHDFEGDGALLYFQGAGEAVPAAFRLREELLRRRVELPALPLPRLSLDTGPIVIGVIGTRFRQTVSLVGPAIHTAARILKLAPPGGIIATEAIVEHARNANPDLAREFARLEGASALLQDELGSVRAWVAAPGDIDSPVT